MFLTGGSMRIEIEKKHEGKTVFGLPTGNNTSRSGNNEPVEFEVVKVKRKYVDLRRKDYTYTNAHHPLSGATQEQINSGHASNAGYKFFESLEDIERYIEHNKKLDRIKEYFKLGAYITLSEEDVSTIHGLIYRT